MKRKLKPGYKYLVEAINLIQTLKCMESIITTIEMLKNLAIMMYKKKYSDLVIKLAMEVNMSSQIVK